MCEKTKDVIEEPSVLKKDLRRRAKAELLNYFSDRELSLQCAKTVADFFLASDDYKKAPVILAYMAMKDEVDLSSIIRKAIEDGKAVALPRMKCDTNEMDFYYIKSLEDDFSKDNKYSILEPAEKSFGKAEIVDPEALPSSSVVLVPGLAFNLNGARLGRGKGFYDRYLSRLGKDVLLCGVCTVNVVTKAIPVEENDIFMTNLLNEYGYVKTHR